MNQCEEEKNGMKQSYHHKNLKNTLIEKGIEMVNENGIKELSLRKLANVCGVSHGAPYSHFSNKEELLHAMKDYITEQFAVCLTDTYEKYIGKQEILLELGKAYVNFFVSHPAYFSFLYTKSDIEINLTTIEEQENNYRPYEIYKKAAAGILKEIPYSDEQKNDIVIAMWTFVHGIAAVATMKNVVYDGNWEDKIAGYLKLFRF